MSLSNHPRIAALRALESGDDESGFTSALVDLANDLVKDRRLR